MIFQDISTQDHKIVFLREFVRLFEMRKQGSPLYLYYYIQNVLFQGQTPFGSLTPFGSFRLLFKPDKGLSANPPRPPIPREGIFLMS